jgi:uncharacterized protein with PIN domain/sulfur carrier protein ThiS
VEPAPSRAYLRFYAELNDHLPAGSRYKTLEKSFFVAGTVKDMIESFGVPHTEVELVIANGESVPFSYAVRDGDRIAVYPVFESFDVTPELQVRREPLREPRFVLDVHLGRLAAYLRMLGFDTFYRNCASDPDLVRISSGQQRILLTRDRGLLKHGSVTHGYLLRETDSHRQLAEVVHRFDLARSIQPFTRCMACNGMLAEAAKSAVQASLPPRVAEVYSEFRQCERCGKVYWKGSHYRRMQSWVRQLVNATIG